MNDKRNIFPFMVVGRGEFPLDMLRYDCAWPQTVVDVASIAPDSRELRIIALESAKVYGVPTEGRWRSFGWTVVPDGDDAYEVLRSLSPRSAKV